MGFENRDYYQEDRSFEPHWGHDTPAMRWLLIVTVLVFFCQVILTYRSASAEALAKYESIRVSYVDEWFMLDAAKTVAGQFWRVLTYAFCHNRQDPFDIIFNMVALWFFGARLERMYGSREFLFFYLASSLTAACVFLGFMTVTPLPAPLSGAGAAVFALFTLYATHFPHERILFCFIVPIEIWVLLLIYAGVDLYRLLQAAQGEYPILLAAFIASHLSGIAFGYFYRHFDWHLSGIAERLNPSRWRIAMRRASTSRKLRVYQPADNSEELDAKVDAILAKIHEQGSDSLTEAERAILTRASERIKNKTRP